MNESAIASASFGYLVMRVARHWRQAADRALAASGLSLAATEPLLVLSRCGGEMRHGCLADAVGIEGPSLVRLIDMLVRDKLVTRSEDPTDRRAKTIALTALGRAKAQDIEAIVKSLRAHLMEGVDARDLEGAVAVLTELDR
jgi:MarR family transcriptional regulator for hemolysin